MASHERDAAEVGPPRTLAQMIRGWDDRTIAALLAERRDLADPPPSDFGQLATDATTRESVIRALDGLTRFELAMASQACRLRAPFSFDALVASSIWVDAARAAVDHLIRLALVWGDVSALRPVRVLPSLVADVDGADPLPAAPHPDAAERRTPALVDRIAAGSAFELVRRMEVVVEHCSRAPIRLLRGGGLAVRDTRLLADDLDLSSPAVRTLLALARAAELLEVVEASAGELLVGGPALASWQSVDLAEQWGVVVASSCAAQDEAAPDLLPLSLAAFGDPAEGRVVSNTELGQWLGWHRPRRLGSARQTAHVLEQLSLLGITAIGARSAFLDATGHRLRLDVLADHLPARVDEIVVQGDFTGVAPGPLTAQAAHDLALLGDLESHGGATVYRFSSRSLSRAFIAGWSGEEVCAVLRRRSRTPLPQPLVYLIDDLAAQPLSRLIHEATPRDRAARASRQSAVDVRATLSDAADDLHGLRRRQHAAAATVSALRESARPPTVDGAEGNQDSGDRAPVLESPVDALRSASGTGETVWFQFADAHGRRAERLVTDVAVSAGVVTALDVRTRDVVTIALSRVVSAHIVRSERPVS